MRLPERKPWMSLNSGGPYIVVASVLFLIGLFVRFSPLPEIENKEEEDTSAGKSGVFQFPNLVLGAVAIFLHVGTQVIAIDTIINYADSMGLSLLEAKALPSYVLTATIIGYLMGITLIPAVISEASQICSFSWANIGFIGLFSNLSGELVGPSFGPFYLVFSDDWGSKCADMGRHLAISLRRFR